MEQTVIHLVWLKMIVSMDTTHATVMAQFNVRRVLGIPAIIAKKVSFVFQ